MAERMERIPAEEMEGRLHSLPGWSLEDGKWLVKKYRFPSFLSAVAFVNEVARIAEAMDHHPMIAIDFRVVTLRFTTWSAAGLTELDVAGAQRANEAFAAR